MFECVFFHDIVQINGVCICVFDLDKSVGFGGICNARSSSCAASEQVKLNTENVSTRYAQIYCGFRVQVA